MDSIEKQQEAFKKAISDQIRTILSNEEYMHLKCVVCITNTITGKIDLCSFQGSLVAEVKMLLQEGLDMLNRQQLIANFIKPKKEE
jgi:hypothetical protein